MQDLQATISMVDPKCVGLAESIHWWFLLPPASWLVASTRLDSGVADGGQAQ